MHIYVTHYYICIMHNMAFVQIIEHLLDYCTDTRMYIELRYAESIRTFIAHISSLSSLPHVTSRPKYNRNCSIRHV